MMYKPFGFNLGGFFFNLAQELTQQHLVATVDNVNIRKGFYLVYF